MSNGYNFFFTSGMVCTKLAKFEQLKANASTNLFAMVVGIKQKDLVNKMVKKVL